MLRNVALCAAFSFLPAVAASAAPATQPSPIRVAVDASQAPQKIYHVVVTMPAHEGAFAFVYPHWIPGYHGPVGPIEAVANVRVSANGTSLPWRRDLVDPYTIATTLPAGARALEVRFDMVSAPSHNGQNEAVGTSQLAVVEFSNFVVYPQGAVAEETPVSASLKLPPGWTFGTALPVASRAGDEIAFAPASLYTLVDSPIVAGAHERAYPLDARHELDVAGDSAAAIDVATAYLTGLKHLIAEGPALYGGEHYRNYHFLLALSDHVGFDGIEHHESSDNRASEKYAMDEAGYRVSADLLPHEYSHSWNGKYRRPADLAVPDYQAPEKTDLLWVYEGLNQYNGEKLATRARLSSFADQLDELAISAASMDAQNGRATRPVRDLADGAPFLYQSPEAFHALRRSAGDFYTEGDLIWLDADVTIRRLTNGARSLDDFCRLFAGGTSADVPRYVPYEEADLYRLLNQVAPYDWAGFFAARVATAQPHAPLGGIEGAGYRLVYTDVASDFFKAREMEAKIVDATYSLGFTISNDDANVGTITDIRTDSKAFAAGLAPGMRIVAVDGRRFTPEVFHRALRAHAGSATPLQLIVQNDETFRTISVDARVGERFPHLVRDASRPDVLEAIYAPKTFAPSQPGSR